MCSALGIKWHRIQEEDRSDFSAKILTAAELIKVDEIIVVDEATPPAKRPRTLDDEPAATIAETTPAATIESTDRQSPLQRLSPSQTQLLEATPQGFQDFFNSVWHFVASKKMLPQKRGGEEEKRLFF